MNLLIHSSWATKRSKLLAFVEDGLHGASPFLCKLSQKQNEVLFTESLTFFCFQLAFARSIESHHLLRCNNCKAARTMSATELMSDKDERIQERISYL